jgi:hypothetical protein
MDLFLELFARPFITLAFFLVAWFISRLIYGLIPEGKVKRAIYSPLPWLRKRGDGG